MIFLTIKSQEISHKDNMHRTIFKTVSHSLVCVLAKYLAVPTKWFLQSHCANLSPYRSYLVSIDKERNNFARASKKSSSAEVWILRRSIINTKERPKKSMALVPIYLRFLDNLSDSLER